MIKVDLHTITQPVGIMRIVATILSCLLFSLVAAVGYCGSSYWAWCMFTWCFCCFFSLLILILEFTGLSTKVPFNWTDFTSAFAMLATLMCLAASILYPTFFTCKTCYHQIGASVVSWVCFSVYAGEVALNYFRPSGQNSGFLSTIPGLMKMVETFVACIIFTSLEPEQYNSSAQLQWCVAVYSLCFIFSILIILFPVGQLGSFLPFSLEMFVIVYNIVAAAMYLSAMVIWPLCSSQMNKSNSSLESCFKSNSTVCRKVECSNKLVMVTIMTIINFIIYTLDIAYSIRVVFCISDQ
ncbi:myeloid-associated differentiation marker homolog [Thalassophryne amazonica]|uniref:myeloid-associated differentiation marker homolog n=1 Tax=Thalassophryne amazonica TaxID=390379 RepID=UPI0014712A82|nr:myeloid-associated differentiation marker homolog [Thalassophryne amazonica]